MTSTTQAGGSGATVLGRTTSYAYDSDGNLTKVTRPDAITRVGVTSAGDQGTTNELDLTYPSGTQPGDVAVLAVSVDVTNASNFTVPSGFTLDETYAPTGSGTNLEIALYTKNVAGTDGTQSGTPGVSVDFNGYFGKWAMLAVYSGVNTC